MTTVTYPTFDAGKLIGLYQGIETVRRDGCPLLVKMLEKVLRLLFTTKDLSQVKGYLYRQWTRILTDRAAVGDFIFAKEVSKLLQQVVFAELIL